MIDFSEAINKLCADNESGSAGILQKTMDVCENYLDQDNPEKGLFTDKMNMLFTEHSGMIVLFHFINALFLSLEKAPEDWNTNALKFIRNYKKQWQDPPVKITGHFPEIRELARKTILVHSNSSMVMGFFEELAARKIFPRVFQTESRPVNEGRMQGRKLLELGFRVNFITDAAIGRFLDEIDLCLLGADAIWDDHFVNKCGSRLYAIAFREAGKPVQVLADSRKILSREKVPEKLYQRMHEENEKSPTEVWPDAPEDINIRNFYFEDIPLNMVSVFHLENGTYEPSQLKSLMKEGRLSNLFNFEQHPGF